MARLLRTFIFVVFFQAVLVRSFLMNTNTSHSLHSSGQETGSDANFLYLLQKVDNLQLQIHQQTGTMEELNKTLETQIKRVEAQSKIMEAQKKTMEVQSKKLEAQNKTLDAQSIILEAQNKTMEVQIKTIEAQSKSMEAQNKTMEAQNKTLEAQKKVIQELMNFTRQTPSTISLRNDLSILEMHVRRIMDEYKTLSNISDTTDLEINKSVRALTLHFTTQDNRVNQMDQDFTHNVNTLNGSLLSVSNRVSQNERDISNHSFLISSSLSRLNTDMVDMAGLISSLEDNITLVMEKRVAFTVSVTSQSDVWSGDILVFPNVVTNTGYGYSTSTGKFIAPRAGTYVFFVTVVSYDTNGLYLAIVHNGVDKVTTLSTKHASWQTGTNLAVLELRQGDTVWVRRYTGQGYYSSSLLLTVPSTTFSGFRL